MKNCYKVIFMENIEYLSGYMAYIILILEFFMIPLICSYSKKYITLNESLKNLNKSSNHLTISY